ncbi:MAG TPA: TonB-dependent receptor, partial [Bacillota bacterium]|nr:TonB-dependent receptor [Bacillota bacterium]
VSGASRFEQKVTEAPASVSIVTADEIKKLGYRTLADVLRGMRGLYVNYDRNYSYLGVRGFSRPGDLNTKELLLIDGHRMNDNIFDTAAIGTEAFLDVDLIERVEFIRGPSSAIYGDNAFFGVINVVTKSGRHIDGAEAAFATGSFDTYQGRFSVGKQFTNELEFLLSGSLYTSAGPHLLDFDVPGQGQVVVRDQDRDAFESFFTKITYRDFTLSGGVVNREKRVPTGSYNTVFNDGREETTDLSAYADLKYEHEFASDTRVLGRVFYDRYNYQGDYPTDLATPPGPPFVVINRDEVLGDRVGTEWQVTQLLFDRHRLVAGVDYRENLQQNQLNFFEEPGGARSDIRNRSRNVGLFAEGEAVLRTNLLFNAGLRFDYYETFGETLNPRFGLIYSPLERTTLKLLYGEAFRAPSVYELYYSVPGVQQANPHLQPESIRTYEAVLEQYLPWHLRFSVSGYYYEVDDLISERAGGPAGFIYDNVDQARGKGVEFELEGRYAGGLIARASYALQRTEDAHTGQELSNSPRHLVRATLIAPLYRDKLFTGLELQYESQVRTLGGDALDGFYVVNWTIFSQRIVKNLELSASLYNLFDIPYANPGAAEHRVADIPQDGRSFRVKLTYRF